MLKTILDYLLKYYLNKTMSGYTNEVFIKLKQNKNLKPIDIYGIFKEGVTSSFRHNKKIELKLSYSETVDLNLDTLNTVGYVDNEMFSVDHSNPLKYYYSFVTHLEVADCKVAYFSFTDNSSDSRRLFLNNEISFFDTIISFFIDADVFEEGLWLIDAAYDTVDEVFIHNVFDGSSCKKHWRLNG